MSSKWLQLSKQRFWFIGKCLNPTRETMARWVAKPASVAKRVSLKMWYLTWCSKLFGGYWKMTWGLIWSFHVNLLWNLTFRYLTRFVQSTRCLFTAFFVKNHSILFENQIALNLFPLTASVQRSYHCRSVGRCFLMSGV